MIPLTFEEAIGYFGVYLFLMAICASLIVALYHLADLVEEHLKTMKKVVLYTIQGTLAALVLLWVLEGVDAATILPTVAAQLGYWRVVSRRFPFLTVRDPWLLGSAALTAVSHIMWMRYHMRTFHHIAVVLGFFLAAVWLVPFQILVSMAANDNCLPGVATGMPTEFYSGGGAGVEERRAGGAERHSGAAGKATRTLLGSIFDSVRSKVPGPAKKDRDW